jgi:uncharacterized DUF497 family protein
MYLVFEWDTVEDTSQSPEARRQLCRSGIGFQRPFARTFDDEDHSAEKHREIIIGHSPARRLLLVCFNRAGRGPCSHHRRSPHHEGRTTRL